MSHPRFRPLGCTGRYRWLTGRIDRECGQLNYAIQPKMASPGGHFTRTGAVVVLDSAKGPVSRILSCAVIPLGATLPRTLISDLPGGFGTCSSHLLRIGPMRSTAWLLRRRLPSLFGLAPCGVYPASCLTAGAVRSYRTFSPLPRHQARPPTKFRRTGLGTPSKRRGNRGGMFSVALAVHGP